VERPGLAAYRDGYLTQVPGSDGNTVQGTNETLNVDMQASWNIRENLKLSLEGVNLTDEFNDQYVGDSYTASTSACGTPTAASPGRRSSSVGDCGTTSKAYPSSPPWIERRPAPRPALTFSHGRLRKLKADTGAKLIASAADRKALETGKYIGSEEVSDYDFPPLKVDKLVKDGGAVSLGGTTLTAHLTPGHTAGCTTWTFPVRIDGAVHQAVVFCSISVAANRLVSKTRGPQYPGIVEDYRRGFAKLKSLKADVFLAPHTAQFDAPAKVAKMSAGGPSPFIDPAELGVVTARYEALFNEALAAQAAAAK
jgi:glyoxylase-like metal-dependent hydrolase (beta-lactamase superfamily II)